MERSFERPSTNFARETMSTDEILKSFKKAFKSFEYSN